MDFLQNLRAANLARCEQIFHPVEEWSITDWACAVAGESGELCNKVKKVRRGDHVTEWQLDEEAADLIIYLDFLMYRLHKGDLKKAVIRKFNIKSLEFGSDVFLSEHGVAIKAVLTEDGHVFRDFAGNEFNYQLYVPGVNDVVLKKDDLDPVIEIVEGAYSSHFADDVPYTKEIKDFYNNNFQTQGQVAQKYGYETDVNSAELFSAVSAVYEKYKNEDLTKSILKRGLQDDLAQLSKKYAGELRGDVLDFDVDRNGVLIINRYTPTEKYKSGQSLGFPIEGERGEIAIVS